MKKLIGFINGFIACMFIIYSFFMYAIFRWARNNEVCGFEITQKYSKSVESKRPKYSKYVERPVYERYEKRAR